MKTFINFDRRRKISGAKLSLGLLIEKPKIKEEVEELMEKINEVFYSNEIDWQPIM